MLKTQGGRVVALLCVLLGCETSTEPETLTREQLMDPETCKDCHPKHYREWSASMHAYAAEDPVFRAMNERGQEQAGIGTFCVNCHAPMAVREGLTKDGLNLDQLPARVKGVTCYFCHNAVGIGSGALHNNPLELASDTTMRGSIKDPLKPSAHGVAYSRFHDRRAPESSAMCGACHDIVNDNGVHLERTFAEYNDSLFALSGGFQSCQDCHMDPRPGVAAVDRTVKVPGREVHEHLWPSVDVALTPFPDRDIMRVAVEQCLLPNSIQISFDANPNDVGAGAFTVSLESIVGHNVPSGATQDRRMWLEVTSYDAQGGILSRSGALADDAIENLSPNDTRTFHDQIFDAQGNEVHMFWEAAPSPQYPTGYLSRSLPAAKSAAAGSHVRSQEYSLGLSPGLLSPARATIRLRMRPMGLDVLHDLVQSGHLDPSIPAMMPTFTMRELHVEWSNSGNPSDFKITDVTDKDCRRYRCLLEGGTFESCGVPTQPASSPTASAAMTAGTP